ncbi:alginate export family protein [Algibacillus agarilyticus]|uniref:alginate export family protein n=1 Tax=Algibacillus agarilyticus TaxID=2234133 RepID=UPI000DCFDDFB|nr:alginate export family protein [Algibacillus agarilyticus]
MKTLKNTLLGTSVTLLALAVNPAAYAADKYTDALIGGKVAGDINLRFEGVDQDNAAKNATALTARTRLTYTTGTVDGFSAVFGVSNTFAILDNYNDTNGKNTEYSVVADPETTEIDQGYIQYSADGITAKLGNQVVTFDGHRHVGHVGWRQDRQTFDGLSVKYAADKFEANYAYFNQRNRIFGEGKDIDSQDHLINLSYKTSAGKLVGYSYMLENENPGAENTIDTYGVSFTGKSGDFLYSAELATQTKEAGGAEMDADYLFLEAGYVINGYTAKLGYESLGSDNGTHGFATPLATLHKFNGWSDQFLGTPAGGLVDIYGSVATKAMGGKVVAAYHLFDSDVGSVDLGSELNVLYAKKLTDVYSGGVKLAMYSAGDIKVDTNKLWVWVGAKF